MATSEPIIGAPAGEAGGPFLAGTPRAGLPRRPRSARVRGGSPSASPQGVRPGHALVFFAKSPGQVPGKPARPLILRSFRARNHEQVLFRFYFHLLKTGSFLHFEVVLSGEKWSEVDLSGLTFVRFPLLSRWLKGDTGAAIPRKLTGHGG